MSFEAARDDYGVVLTGLAEAPVLDQAATSELRERLRAERPAQPFFDRGPGYPRLAGGADEQ